MATALDRYVIRGVNHNIPFLNALVNHPAFKKGELTTGFIDEHYPDGFSSSADASGVQQSAESMIETVAIAAFAQSMDDQRALQIDNQLRRSQEAQDLLCYSALLANNEKVIDIKVKTVQSDPTTSSDGIRTIELECDGQKLALSSNWRPGKLNFEANLVSANLASQELVAQLDRDNNAWRVTSNGRAETVKILRPAVAALEQLMPEKVPPDLSRFLLSPMPGLLIKVSVGEGEGVKAGQELAVVEAMKMENVLTAEQDATVKVIQQKAGASLSVDEVIIEFE